MPEDQTGDGVRRRAFVAGALAITAAIGSNGLLTGCGSGEQSAGASPDSLDAPPTP
ncbi:MAG: hypothetical protein QOH03_1319, partial [Kribbellaceae bacterium]|nr:hypothetical protein [Kribbellaceae bacterium]